MRLLYVFLLVLFVPAALEAAIVCGTFDGKFTCKAGPGATPRGKNAGPAIDTVPPADLPESSPAPSDPGGTTGNPGQWDATGTPAPSGTQCGRGMIGTPPNCQCPPNSELLGGNCVRYTAVCTALAANVNPAPCKSAEEKLACKMRDDGLKDCCCLTYSKF